ncbi:uncharacterized protein LOC143211185 [Lasioglossum baleicum]|uniref:uncharacterized protein LOC143211185 n=1 Tax=Lasioglossum baleicum TaxID=434251 RepID=UPI003FCDD45F
MAVTPRDRPPVWNTDLELQVQSRRPRHRWKKENENLEPIVNGSSSESGRVSAVFPEEPREPPNYRPVNRNEGSLVFLPGVIGRNWARAGNTAAVLVCQSSIGIQGKRKNWIDNCDLGSRRGRKK